MTALHPGTILSDKIKSLTVTQDIFAAGTGIHFVTLNRLIKGHELFTPRWDALLCKALSLKQGFFLHAKVDYDLAQFMADPDKKKGGRGGQGFKTTFAEALAKCGVYE